MASIRNVAGNVFNTNEQSRTEGTVKEGRGADGGAGGCHLQPVSPESTHVNLSSVVMEARTISAHICPTLQLASPTCLETEPGALGYSVKC